MYFHDPFKLIPLGGEGGIADIADKLARNEIATSNELRQKLGWKPSTEPKADKLINSNMPTSDTGVTIDSTADEIVDTPDPAATAMIDDLASTTAELDAALGQG
jgi:hypothetical protein